MTATTRLSLCGKLFDVGIGAGEDAEMNAMLKELRGELEKLKEALVKDKRA